jgi:hypothetical protein
VAEQWTNQSYFAEQYGHHNISLQYQNSMSVIPSNVETSCHKIRRFILILWLTLPSITTSNNLQTGHTQVTINHYLKKNEEVFNYKRFIAKYPQVVANAAVQDGSSCVT